MLITAEELEKAMSAIGELNYTGNAEERPKNIRYAKGKNVLNFIWNGSLYQLDLNKNQIACIIKDLGQTKFALEGRDYEWTDENNLVYVTFDEQGINSIMKYDLQIQEKSFIHYGSGVCLIEGEEKYEVFNEMGEIVIPFEYDYFPSYNYGVARVKRMENIS